MTKNNADDILDFLKHVGLFKGIPENLIRLLLNEIEIKEFNRGEDIIREGEHGNTIFILMNGEVSVTKKLTLLTGQFGASQVDKALIKLKHTNYAFFGEMAMCGEGDVRSATVRAETECILAELSAKQIKTVIDDNPEFGAKFYKNLSAVLADRLRKSNRDILKLTTALTLALEE
jgi:CRP-like cAMP-binding protein